MTCSLDTKEGCRGEQSATLGIWQIYYMCLDSHNQSMQLENLINIPEGKIVTSSGFNKQEPNASIDKTLDLTLAQGSISPTIENSNGSQIVPSPADNKTNSVSESSISLPQSDSQIHDLPLKSEQDSSFQETDLKQWTDFNEEATEIDSDDILDFTAGERGPVSGELDILMETVQTNDDNDCVSARGQSKSTDQLQSPLSPLSLIVPPLAADPESQTDRSKSSESGSGKAPFNSHL